jgi:hypothetical protein
MNTQLIDSLINIIKSLPEEEQLIFYQKLPPYQGKNNQEISAIDWENEPFIGMGQDREDMKDSQQWVRQLRQQEWN